MIGEVWSVSFDDWIEVEGGTVWGGGDCISGLIFKVFCNLFQLGFFN